MSTHTEPAVPSAEEAILAQKVSRALEQQARASTLRLQISGAEEDLAFDLPPMATDLLMEILKQMAEGNAVSLVPMQPEVTTQQAADLLNVSRPYLVGLIDKGDLPYRMVGNQRRLPLGDVLAYRRENQAKRRDALRELVAVSQELGLE
jgi:excisionase family DNA binding protein